MKTRNESLDALRGFAILTMVLSGSIAYGDVMPSWMYHAQVPPPLHQFNPAIAGITWVDLVFPFFLFSMGAAMPLSLKKHVEANSKFGTIAWIAFKRFILLAFFALFSQHMKAWVISETPLATDHLLSMLAFALLFFQFYDNRNEQRKRWFLVLKLTAFILAVFLLWKLPFNGGAGFSFYKSDIIIMVLANMAFFGTIIYYLTAKAPLLRIGVLPFILAVFLASKEPDGGWAKAVFNFNHIGSFQFDWLYKFYFLKYLFIIIPGTFAGEFICQSVKMEKRYMIPKAVNSAQENLLAIVSLSLVICNLYCLFTRLLLLNLIVTILLCSMAWLLIKKEKAVSNLVQQFTQAGICLLLLGLFFEVYEGGIKKDSSTYSYYFVTSGLAFFMLIIFTFLARNKYLSGTTNYFSLNGKNPMVAYVAGALILLPLLSLTHTKIYWDSLQQNAWMGLLKGVLFTGIVSLITIFFVKRKWFWKT
jgi:predicted acyltransferase